MEAVGVGIVGSAFAAGLHADAYGRCPYATIVAASSKAPEELRRFCQRFEIPHVYDDLEGMLAREDIQLVSVCAPNFTHKELVLAALGAGKHVICEKPLATTTEDAKAMVTAAQAAGRRLFYAEDWVFAPALVRVAELIGEGAVGRVVYVKAKETHLGSHSPFAQKREYCGGGAMIHLGIHAIGFALALMQEEVTEVWGAVTGGGDANLVHQDYTGEDWGVGLLTFAGGTRALVEGNYVTVGGLDDIVEVYGSDGVIKVDLSQGSPLTVYSRPGFAYAVEKADTTKGWTRPAVDELRNLGYPDEIAHFVDCVRREQPAKRGVRAEDGLRALQVVQAIYRSAEAKRVVELSRP
jgi:predicted dehydrogenase